MIHAYPSSKHTFLREVYIETDTNSLITFISENCYNILGYTQDELLNKKVNNYIVNMPQDIVSTINLKTKFVLKNNTYIDVDIIIDPIINDIDALIGLKFSIIDISKYIQFNYDTDRIVKMFERSKDIIYRVELLPEFKFTYISPSIKEILGYTLEEHFKNPNLPTDIVHPDDIDYMLDKISGKIDYTFPTHARYRHKDGHYIWLEDYNNPVYDENRNITAIEGVSRDITIRKNLEENLKKLSYYDGLTGIHNKLYLENQINLLNFEVDTSIGIIFCDLNNLKIVNDTLGHEFGDTLIKYVSNILKDIFNMDSIVARSGGDEFVVIIKNTTSDEVKYLYSKLCTSIKQQNKYNKELAIDISIGYSFSETSIGTIRQVINIADKNMYKDKLIKKLKNRKYNIR